MAKKLTRLKEKILLEKVRIKVKEIRKRGRGEKVAKKAKKIEKVIEEREERVKKDIKKVYEKIPTRLRVSSRQFRKGILPATKDVTQVGRGVAKLFGAPTSAQQIEAARTHGRARGRPVGRPVGTYKYGKMSALEFRKLQTQRRTVLQLRKNQQINELIKRGYSIDQARQALTQRSQISERPEQGSPREKFKELVENQAVSPNTLNMLERLKQVQRKAEIDDFEQQRRNKEKRMVAEAGNIMKARNMFGPDSSKFNILETEGNILTAPSVFKEDPNDNLLRQNRLTLLNTKEAGNDLQF